MLIRARAYTGNAAEITYDPAVYAQMTMAAICAWKALSNTTAGEQLSKVLQETSEPFSDFADCLLQLTGRILEM